MIRTDVQLGSKSIPGHRHRVEGRENEDVGFVSHEHPMFDAVMIVADGMGGHPEPRQAAQTAIAAAREFLFAPERRVELLADGRDMGGLLQRAVQHANGRVRRLAGEPQRTARSVTAAPSAPVWNDEKPPGCTLILAIIFDGRLAVANVGDGSVFLFRARRLLPLAGGEARRLGSRPEEFLGRAERVDVETAEDRVEQGDRILLCTDGLTRYFGGGQGEARPRAQGASGSAGLERLQQVVGRVSADPQALASQLTADGRGELYDDDTTVVVADIGSSQEVADPRPLEGERRREEPERMAVTPHQSTSRSSASPALLPVALITALAAGVAIGMWHPWQRSPGSQPSPFQPYVSSPVDLSSLPRGGVVLIQRGTSRVYVLRTRPVGTPPSDDPVTLSELRIQASKVVKDTGNSYLLDMARGRLVDPNGHAYPVTVDGATGVIQVQQGGMIRLNTKSPGLPISIDGHSAGLTPGPIAVQAGRHQVQVKGLSGGGVVWDFWVEVPPGLTISFSQDLTSRRGARVVRP